MIIFEDLPGNRRRKLNRMDFENLIDPDDLDAYACMVKAFAIGHGEMAIDLTHIPTKTSAELHLTGVEYFSGPVRWKGADFQIASFDATLQLIQTVILPEAPLESQETWAQRCTLYTVDCDKYVISILAVEHRLGIE